MAMRIVVERGGTSEVVTVPEESEVSALMALLGIQGGHQIAVAGQPASERAVLRDGDTVTLTYKAPKVG